jgi:guanine deaminase
MPRALRGRLLSFGAGDAPFYEPDGVVLIEAGVIVAVGRRSDVVVPPGAIVEDHGGRLIAPGFIDPHIHYPQCRMIASYGAQLIEWLDRYTFPAEQKFADPAYAASEAAWFLDELLRQGTTTACVYCTVHPESVEAFFAESERRGTCMIAGKVMMDRHAPAALCDDPVSGSAQSEALLRRWHGRGRQLYAITPRFAITSSAAQLEAAGALARAYPDAYVQTHLAENLAEIAEVRRLYPQDASYTAVYARAGLLGPRSLLGHCIHLGEDEVTLLREKGAVAVFCPTSNLFLGSGLFDWARLAQAGVRIGLATDVGGGTSYSMLRTAAEAYKVLQLQGQDLPAFAAFRAITRGNAEALGLEGRIGSLAVGYDADLVVLDTGATPAMRHRLEAVGDSLADELFMLMTMADDRAVAATYVAGRRC